MKKGIFFCLILLLSGSVYAQRLSGGFRAGLNISNISGPSETGPNGEDLEMFTSVTGFHIGAVVGLELTDIFGFRGELSYTQRGTQYAYNGDSFWLYETAARGQFQSTGTRMAVLTVSNAYMSVPLTSYIRVGRVELLGGIGVGVYLSGRGTGELTYNGVSSRGTTIPEMVTALDYNFGNDFFGRNDFREDEFFDVDGQTLLSPKNIGAYYESNGSDKNLFKTIDYYAIVGLSVYVNKSMFIGGRINYGLTDITRSEQDFSKLSLGDNNQFIHRDDFDRNISIEASIGFSF